jgi:hypothetical protein
VNVGFKLVNSVYVTWTKSTSEVKDGINVGLKGTVAQRLFTIPGIGRVVASFCNRLFVRRFVPDLQRLHDVLEETDLSGHYWIRAGMLLGWAREGTLLAHDRDADFGVLAEDLPRLLGAISALRRAGFRPLMRFRNNERQTVELTFIRHGTKFEFFILEPVDDQLRYFVFGWHPDHLFQIEKRLPAQGLVPFDFLDRKWLRPDDFELELRCMYGDWRIPKRDWNYLRDARNEVNRQPWVEYDTTWSDGN